MPDAEGNPGLIDRAGGRIVDLPGKLHRFSPNENILGRNDAHRTMVVGRGEPFHRGGEESTEEVRSLGVTLDEQTPSPESVGGTGE